MQPGVLGLGLLEDGDVGIGVFPEGEEILIRLAGGCRRHTTNLCSSSYRRADCGRCAGNAWM
jgi:hypothetical protein